MNTFKECIECNAVREITKDFGKINYLIKTANSRIKFLKTNNISKDNVNFIFEGYYSSITEYLHSLSLQKGWKIENHICLGYFLRDYLEFLMI